MSMPEWLLRQLMGDGIIAPGGMARRARTGRCRCHAQVVIGFSHPDRCALPCRVDPTPLSPLGEALARVEGRYTVTLNREGGHLVLNDRYDLQIAGRPAGTRINEDVLREHRCDTPPPIGQLVAESTHAPGVANIPPNAQPPF